MKFLLFNIIVGAALVYLFSAENGELNTLSEKAGNMGQQVRQKVSDLTSDPAEENRPLKDDKLTKEPVPESQQKMTNKSEENAPVEVAHKPVQKPQPVSTGKTGERTLPPEVMKRRDEILNGKNEPVEQFSDNQLSEKSDRRDRLLRLAEDMELYSLEAIAQ
ncbi:MAG: hypothetical protein MI743_01315 [Sneathiellales bacterium]|nr:hypothetical protein [Sneathiellales bacterium]